MKAFVLLSGGMDSTTCLYYAIKKHGKENVMALGIDYGQVHSREREYALETCKNLDVPYQVIQLGEQPSSALTDTEKNQEIPDKSYDELGTGVSPSYHPFRNGQMLAIIAAWAHAKVGQFKGTGMPPDDMCGMIYAGQHAEDAKQWAYPDCTPEFLGAMANAIFVGTYFQIRLENPLVYMTKAEVVQLGDKLEVDWNSTYSCYHGGYNHCGKCPTCQSRHQAFVQGRVYPQLEEKFRDPTVYQTDIDEFNAKNPQVEKPDDDFPF